MGLRDFTLSDVIDRNAQLHGDRLAFVADGQRVSHREYALRVERLAAGLAGLGLVAGERVAVLAQNCLAYVELYGAAARLGLILVPVNWRLSAEEIAYVITDTTPKAIVAGAEYVPIIEAARDRFPFVERCLSLGAASGAFGAFEDLARTGAGTGAPAADFPSDSGFVIIHTAAVGGRPRGALLSHAGLLAANLQLGGCWDLSTRDVHLGVLPLFHASGLGLMLAVQQAGGATVVLPRFEPQAVTQAIGSEKVTVFAEFPPMLGTAARQGGQGWRRPVEPAPPHRTRHPGHDQALRVRVSVGALLDRVRAVRGVGTGYHRAVSRPARVGRQADGAQSSLCRRRSRPAAAGRPDRRDRRARTDGVHRLLELRRRQCIDVPQRLAPHR